MKNAQNNNQNNIAVVTDNATSLNEKLVKAIIALIANVCVGKNVFMTATGVTALEAAKAAKGAKIAATGLFVKTPGKKPENFAHIKVAAKPASWAVNNAQEVIVIGSSEKMKAVISAAVKYGRTVYAIADDGTFTQFMGKSEEVEAAVEKKEATKMENNMNNAKASLVEAAAKAKSEAAAVVASLDEKKAVLVSLEEKQKDITAKIAALKEEIQAEEDKASSAAAKEQAVKAIVEDAMAKIAALDQPVVEKEEKKAEGVATIKEAAEELRNDPEEQAIVAEDLALLDDEEIAPVAPVTKHEDPKVRMQEEAEKEIAALEDEDIEDETGVAAGTRFQFGSNTIEVLSTEFNMDAFDLASKGDRLVMLAKAMKNGLVKKVVAA